MTKEEFAKALREKGATEDQARRAFKEYTRGGGTFENLATQEDLKNTVSQQVDVSPASEESAEKAKFISYLQQKGYDASTATASHWKKALFTEDSSYKSVNRQLTKELSVKSQGPIKKTPKITKGSAESARVERIISVLRKMPSPYGENKRLDEFYAQRAAQGELDRIPSSDPWGGNNPVKDFTLSLAESGILIGEAMQGIIDYSFAIGNVVTGGRVSYPSQSLNKYLDIDPQVLHDWVAQYYSEGMKRSQFELAQEQGFLSKLKKTVTDPNLSLSAVTQSIGPMLLGAGVARNLVARGWSGRLAASYGEGFKALGLTLHSIEKDQNFGDLNASQLYAVTSSAMATALIALGSAKLQKYYGLDDIDVRLAGGSFKKAPLKHMGGSAFFESFIEELPQSVQEQILQNIAEGKPWDSGLDDAASQGIVAGAFMGLGTGFVAGAQDGPVTGFDGGAFTTDDIERLRQRPDIMRRLTPSYEADLLKKAVDEDDRGALDELNQRIEGVKEELEEESQKEAEAQEKTTAKELPSWLPREDYNQWASGKLTDHELVEKLIAVHVPQKGKSQVTGGATHQQAVAQAFKGALEELAELRSATGVKDTSKVVTINNAKFNIGDKVTVNGRNATVEYDYYGFCPSLRFEDGSSVLASALANEDVKPLSQPTEKPSQERQEALTEEARKYDSAEEFVESRTTVYHGTPNTNVSELKASERGDLGKGVYFAREEQTAKNFADMGFRNSTLEPYGDGKFVDINTGEIIEPEEPGTIKVDIENIKIKRFTPEEYHSEVEQLRNKKTNALPQNYNQKIQEKFRERGFEGIEITGTTRGETDQIVVFPEAANQIKTKQQLTDIWNKAQQEKSTEQKETVESAEQQETTEEREEPPVAGERSQETVLEGLKKQSKENNEKRKDRKRFDKETKSKRKGVPRVLGLSRKANDLFNDVMKMMRVSKARRVKWTETLRNAFDKKLHMLADNTIAKVARGEQINSEEVAGLLIRKAMYANEMEFIENKISEAEKAGKTARVVELQGEYDYLMDQVMQISETARQGATENARAVAAMAMWMDRKSFTLENVLSQYRKKAGKSPDKQTRQELENIIDELNATDKELEALEGEEETDEREFLIDQLQRVHRRIRQPNRKKADKNADIKFLLKRQDRVIKLNNELRGRKTTRKEKKTIRKPDSEGYGKMAQELERLLKEKKKGDRKVAKNIKLIDKRDRLIEEVETFTRFIEDRVKKLDKKRKETKLKKDIKLYEEAKRDQDTIAELLRQLREGRDTKKSPTKQDVFGYKQTINNLRKELYRKENIEKLKNEIAELEKQLETGEKPKKPEPKKKKVDRVTKRLRKYKSDLKKKIAEREERERLLKELRTVSRRIRKKKSRGEDVNEDVKLAHKHQSELVDIINEINRGKPKKEQIKKVRKPDSEGYAEMIEALLPELQEKRTERRLDEEIKQMEEALESGDLSAYDNPKEFRKQPQEILRKRARKKALQKEINRKLRDARPNTVGKYIWQAYDVLREAKLTADIGHIFRQGGFMMSSPRMWAEGRMKTFIAESFKALASGKKADEVDIMVMSMPHYDLGQEAGLRIIQEGEQLDAREEILLNSLISKMKGIGRAQKAFARTQITGINVLRQLAFESMVEAYGGNITLEEAKDVAFCVNILTGYGEYKSGGGKLDRALNKIMISPRFRFSRLQAPILLALSREGRPIWKNKVLRNRIAQDTAMFFMTRILLAAGAGYAGEKLFGDDIKFITDPKSWAFGRVAVRTDSGRWRVYNPWAGVSNAYSLGANIYKKKDIMKAMTHSVETGAHPFLQMVTQVWQRETYSGESVPRYEPLIRSFVPISIEGGIEAGMKDTGQFDLMASITADVVGVDNMLVDEEDLFKPEKPKKPTQPRNEGWF